MSAKARLSYQYCFAEKSDQANLDFDIVTNGHFHHKILQIQDKIKSLVKTKQSTYSTRTEIGVSFPLFVIISPLLNLIITRPSNPTHFKYEKITK